MEAKVMTGKILGVRLVDSCYVYTGLILATGVETEARIATVAAACCGLYGERGAIPFWCIQDLASERSGHFLYVPPLKFNT